WRRLVRHFCVLPFAALAVAGAAGEARAQATAACTVLASGMKFQQSLGGASTGFAVTKLTLDSSAVYWFEYDTSLGIAGGSLRRVPKSGGTVAVLASGLGGVNDFAVDSSSIYWTEFDIPTGNGAIKSAPIAD